MNRGLNGFPTRQSIVTSTDPYAPADGEALVLANADIVKGDVVVAAGSMAGVPLQNGNAPTSGTAGASLGAVASAIGSLSNIKAIGADGTTSGDMVLAYATESLTYSAGALIHTGNDAAHDACTISSGNYVVAFRTSTTAAFYRYDSSGTAQQSNVTVEALADMADVGVGALADGGFVVAYSNTTATGTKFGRYNASGVLQGSLTTVEAAGAPSGGNASACGLTSGEFVVAYPTTTGNAVKFGRFNASGTLQGSLTSVSTSSNGKSAVAALSGGGFVVAVCNPSNYPSYAVYNASGALQGSVTTIQSTAATYIDCFGLNDGGFVVAYSTGTAIRFSRHNSSGTLQGSITTVYSGSATFVACAATPAGDFVIAWYQSGPSVQVAKYSAAGVLLNGPTQVDAKTAQDISIAALLDDRFAVVYNDSTIDMRQSLAVYTGSASFARFNKSGTLQGSATALQATPSTSASVARLDGGGFVVAYTNTNRVPQVARFDANGTLQGSVITPEAVYSTNVAVAPLNNGGFVVAYQDVLNSLVRARVYDAAGTALTTASTIEAVLSAWVAVSRLGGGFAVAYLNASSQPRLVAYSGSWAQTLAPTTVQAVTASYVSVAGLQNGTMAVLFNASGASPRAWVVSAAGAALFGGTTIEAVNNTSGSVVALPGSEYAVSYNDTTGNTVKVARYAYNAVLQGTLTTVESKASTAACAVAATSGDYWSYYQSTSDTDVRFGRFGSAAVILGAALKSVARGGLVPVKIAGYATLRRDWGAPKAFDYSSASPLAGNSGSILGRTINLTGL